ncbi:MAG: terminase, partial [Pseudobutyrivibrio sp.]|nr:terminase [Pseudobutyrivibrio sp.]
MPTKSNNIGGRGGARPGAGRKKKALADKVATGNPGGRPLVVLDIPDMPEPVELEGADMPEP